MGDGLSHIISGVTIKTVWSRSEAATPKRFSTGLAQGLAKTFISVSTSWEVDTLDSREFSVSGRAMTTLTFTVTVNYSSEHPEAAAKNAQVTFPIPISYLWSKELQDQGAGVKFRSSLLSLLVCRSSSQMAQVKTCRSARRKYQVVRTTVPGRLNPIVVFTAPISLKHYL